MIRVNITPEGCIQIETDSSANKGTKTKKTFDLGEETIPFAKSLKFEIIEWPYFDKYYLDLCSSTRDGFHWQYSNGYKTLASAKKALIRENEKLKKIIEHL
jgi:hypothetical protein